MKEFLLRRASGLGEFLRTFPSCAVVTPSTGGRRERDSLPLPVVEETEVERGWRK